jgi:Ca-activated chloride channel family protein
MGMQNFDFKDGTGKAMILMTDAENHEDDAVAAASKANDKGVAVHVVGIGSEEGSPIPIIKDGKQAGFHTDSAGKVVISKLDENMGKEIAAAGNGVYVRATNANNGLNIVMDQVAKMQRKQYDSKEFKDFEDRFQVLIALAFILLVIEFFISNRKSLRLSKLKLFEVKEAPQP